MSEGGADYRFISDPLGSVRMVVNSISGSILHQSDHDPYGRVIVDSKYGSDIIDPTGRDMFRLRMPGFSVGCVTAKAADSWREVNSLIGCTKLPLGQLPKSQDDGAY